MSVPPEGQEAAQTAGQGEEADCPASSYPPVAGRPGMAGATRPPAVSGVQAGQGDKLSGILMDGLPMDVARFDAIRRLSPFPCSAGVRCPAPEPPRRAGAAAPDSGRFGHGPERAPFRPATPRRVPAARIGPLDAATARRHAPGPGKGAEVLPKREPPLARLRKDDDVSMRKIPSWETGPAARAGPEGG